MSEIQEVKKPNGSAPHVEEPRPKNLVQKLCEVMGALKRVPKNGWNDFHKYKFALESDLVEAVREELSSRNLFIFPSVISNSRSVLQRSTRDGIKETGLTDVMVRWTFVDGDSGELRECDMPGCGEDSGDKGIYKALTGSEKYLLMKAFLIPTGDDPERDDKGSREAAQEVGKQKLKDFENGKAARAQAKSGDLSKPLQDSIASAQAARPATNGHGKPEMVQTSLEAAKDDGLFDEISGTIQTVKQMQTSAAKGSRPYRKIVMTTIFRGKLTDVELSAFDNFKMSDGTCFAVLDADETIGSTARFVVERNGKYVNLKDIKQLGKREWDARLGVIQRDAEPKEKLW